MGYVHDTSLYKFIHPNEFANSAGTWTLAQASNVQSMNRSAADASFTTMIPVTLPGSATAGHGA